MASKSVVPGQPVVDKDTLERVPSENGRGPAKKFFDKKRRKIRMKVKAKLRPNEYGLYGHSRIRDGQEFICQDWEFEQGKWMVPLGEIDDGPSEESDSIL